MLFESRFVKLLKEDVDNKRFIKLVPFKYSEILMRLPREDKGPTALYVEWGDIVDSDDDRIRLIYDNIAFTKGEYLAEIPDEVLKNWKKVHIIKGDVINIFSDADLDIYEQDCAYIVLKTSDIRNIIRAGITPLLAYVKPTNISRETRDAFSGLYS